MQQAAEDDRSAVRHVPGGTAPSPPEEIQQQGDQCQRRGRGDAADGAGGGDVPGQTPAQQPPGQAVADDGLAEGLDDLAGGGGLHVALALGIAPDDGHHAHEEHGGGQDLHRRFGQGVVEQAAQGPGQDEHAQAGYGAHDEEQAQRHAKDPALLILPAQGLRLGHHPAHGQRQSGGGQGQQQAVDVVGGVEMGHALAVQQVPQGDLVQRADELGDDDGGRQDHGTAQKALPSWVGHVRLLDGIISAAPGGTGGRIPDSPAASPDG